MLEENLAKKIVQEVRKLLNEEIVVMDTEGIIIASTNINRMGTFHEGALITCKRKEKLIITKEDEVHLTGVKAGINLPICFGQSVVGVIGITGNPEKVLLYAELLRKMTELLIQESIYKEEISREKRTIEAFVFDWIELREWDTAFYNRADLLGINLKVPRLVIMIKVLPYTHTVFDFSSKWSNTLHTNDLLINWGNDRLLLLLDATSDIDHKHLKQKLSEWKNKMEQANDFTLTFGIGTIVHPLDLKKSFLKAERALHAITEKNWIVFDDELTLEMIIEDLRMDTKKEFVGRTIGPLLKDSELMHTIRILFEKNNSLKETAEHLHIHINTLHYRLKKIEELTKLNPKNIKDQSILYLGIIILDQYTK
ncbi:CdaR family transcriptional regulator [Heyndrickxia sp. NPDC080065]|uniref:CdaR family transcriptional regulator n=1 Tax=Heyndrickxia sp. NPDC080065 TaxID=3390568 RepID=UPI003D03BD1C